MTYNAVTLISAVNKLGIPHDQYTYAKIQGLFSHFKVNQNNSLCNILKITV